MLSKATVSRRVVGLSRRAVEGLRHCSGWPPLPEEEEAENALRKGRLSLARDAAERVDNVVTQLSPSLPGGDGHPLLEGRLLPLLVNVSRRVPSMRGEARERMRRLISAKESAGVDSLSILRLRQELFTLHLFHCDSSAAVEECDTMALGGGDENLFRSTLCSSRLAHSLAHGHCTLQENQLSSLAPHLQVEGLCELAAGAAVGKRHEEAADTYERALEIYRSAVKQEETKKTDVKSFSDERKESDVKVTATFDAKRSEKSEKLKRRLDRVEQHISLCVADVLLRVSDYSEVSGKANDILTSALNWTEEDNTEEFPLALSLMAESLSRQGNNSYSEALHVKAITASHSPTSPHYADVHFTAMLQHRTHDTYASLMRRLDKEKRLAQLLRPPPLLPREALPATPFTPPPALSWLTPLAART